MKTYTLKITSAVGIDGEIIRPGALVEVSESEAKNLLHRGKAVVATEADGAPAQDAGDGDQGDGGTGGTGGSTAKASDGLNVDQLKAALTARNVTIPDTCKKKADLAALLDAQPAEPAA